MQGKTTLQAQCHQQVKGEESTDLCRNFKIGFDQSTENAQKEEQDCGVCEVVHDARNIESAPMLFTMINHVKSEKKKISLLKGYANGEV